MGKGYNPERRHDGRHWLKSLDKARADQAGMPLPHCKCIGTQHGMGVNGCVQ